MYNNLRFVILLMLLMVFPHISKGKNNQDIIVDKPIVLSDSLIRVYLNIADSISKSNTLTADSILNSLLKLQVPNKDLLEKIIDTKCITLRFLSRTKESITFLEEIIANGNTNPKYYLELAKNHKNIYEYSKAISIAQEAILKYKSQNDLIGAVDVINYLISVYGEIGMYNEADKYFKESIQFCKKINYNNGLMNAYIEYARVLVFENTELSSELFLNAKIIAEAKGDDEICQISTFLIQFYINTHQNALAKSYVKQYFNKCSGFNDKLNDSNIYTLMAHIYSLENNEDSTIYYNNKALSARLQVGNNQMIASSYINLSGDYLRMGDVFKANEFLDKAEEAVLDSKNLYMRLNYFSGKVKYYQYVNDYKNAFLFSQEEIKLNRELANQQYQSSLSKLNASFEIYQRNIMLEKELEKRKATARLIYFILSIILIFFVVIYFYFLFKKKNIKYLNLKDNSIIIEKELKNSKNERLKLQTVFENNITGILILNKMGIIQYGNIKSKELLNIENDTDFLEVAFGNFFEDDIKDQVKQTLLNIFNESQVDKSFKVQVKNRKDFHWLNISFTPLYFENEEDSILVALIDITLEVINIEKEKEQKKQLQTLINSVTESILYLHIDGKILALNNTAAVRLNSRIEDLIGVNYFEILPEVLLKNRKNIFNRVIQFKKPIIETEIEGVYNNMVSIYPNINAEGEVDFVSEFVQDITERSLAEEKINNLNQRVLQSQMNPHFIFNSLTSIQSFVIRNNPIEASKYLNSFARLFRLILENSRQEYIYLKNEIELLNYYLEIQKMRLADNFIYSFEIDPTLNLESIKIPSMLAQPFIENSIEHGIQHLDKLGELNIKFAKGDKCLRIELKDNGIGRDASFALNKDNVLMPRSLSTQIINERLNAVNKKGKDKISYTISDLKNKENEAIGTLVVINVQMENI